MKNIYYYLFYRLFLFTKTTDTVLPFDFFATLIISILEIAIFLIFLNCYILWFDDNFMFSRFTFILILLCIGNINCYFFIYKEEWKQYIHKFDMLPRKINLRYAFTVWFFIFLIVFLFFYTFYLIY